ncbi:protein phosphatase 2C domain-containing protein [Natronosalvus halobius]|uniref:protein phosphatase 2C domain-containing protein n=1 Tax=Natronosalvus halobius TaxID=2953746 RepID=UPI0020A01241|nr:protein phosphatase 2C domain-containing protein [Natronosalvus halobius]USZ71830.1 protein phosphatase 2C domain-containing protein [Natronosalvus halobius]
MVSIEARVDAGSKPNEDLAWHGENTVAILDGATGLGNQSVTDRESDGRWYVERLAEELSSQFERDRDLETVAAEAVASVSDDFEKLRRAETVAQHERPSAAGVCCRWTEDKLEYFVLGDCTLIVRSEDGVDVIRGEGPRELDRRVIDTMVDIRNEAGSIPHDALLERVRPMLVEHRARQNEPDGYWTFGLDPAATSRGRSGTYDLATLRDALLFTDGFEPLCELYDAFEGWKQVLRYVDDNGLERAIRLLRAFENADPGCEAFPRLKPSDDVGVVALSF